MKTQTLNKNCGFRVLFLVFMFRFLSVFIFVVGIRFVVFGFPFSCCWCSVLCCLVFCCFCFRFRYFVWFRCVGCICRFKGFQISFYGFQMVSSILFVTFCFMCFPFCGFQISLYAFQFQCVVFVVRLVFMLSCFVFWGVHFSFWGQFVLVSLNWTPKRNIWTS